MFVLYLIVNLRIFRLFLNSLMVKCCLIKNGFIEIFNISCEKYFLLVFLYMLMLWYSLVFYFFLIRFLMFV